MNTVHTSVEEPKVIPMKDLPRGCMGVVTEPSYTQYNGIVVLAMEVAGKMVFFSLRGNDQWSKNCPLMVRKLERGDIVTLEVI